MEAKLQTETGDSEIVEIGLKALDARQPGGTIDTPDGPHTEAVNSRLENISAEAWFRLAKWAKQKNYLTPWQRSLAYSLGRLAAVGRTTSPKQTLYAAAILDEARKLGFDPRFDVLG